MCLVQQIWSSQPRSGVWEDRQIIGNHSTEGAWLCPILVPSGLGSIWVLPSSKISRASSSFCFSFSRGSSSKPLSCHKTSLTRWSFEVSFFPSPSSSQLVRRVVYKDCPFQCPVHLPFISQSTAIHSVTPALSKVTYNLLSSKHSCPFLTAEYNAVERCSLCSQEAPFSWLSSCSLAFLLVYGLGDASSSPPVSQCWSSPGKSAPFSG